MTNSKFLKLAVSGVAVAAIAIGIGVGVGVHNKNTKAKDAAASSATQYDECGRRLLVPGIEDEDYVADASTRRNFMARSLGNNVESYESTESWYGDAYQAPAPAASNGPKGPKGSSATKGSSSKGPKGPKGSSSKGPKGPKGSSSKGPKGPKGSSATKGSSTNGPKGPKGSSSKGPKGPKGSSSKGPKGPKGPKGLKSEKMPVRAVGFLFYVHLYYFVVLTFLTLLNTFHVARIVLLLCGKERQMR